jgi:hypothetical protein
VRGGGHSSGTRVAARLVRPTLELGRAALERSSTWPCSGWGLPCHARYRARGGLLLHRFTLTWSGKPAQAVCFSVALSSRSPSPGVTRHPALWSPDFPPGAEAPSDRLNCCGARNLAPESVLMDRDFRAPSLEARRVHAAFTRRCGGRPSRRSPGCAGGACASLAPPAGGRARARRRAGGRSRRG